MTLYKYCRRCGRELKGMENRLRGFGEICFQKFRAEAEGRAPLWESTSEQAEKSNFSQFQSQGQSMEQPTSKHGTEQSRVQRAEQFQSQSAKQIQSQGAKAKQAGNSQSKKQSNPPHFKKALTPPKK